MTQIVGFSPMSRTIKAHRTRVECYWAILEGDNGAKLVQLDTRGSPNRDKPNAQSQTIQLDRTAASQLVSILKREFRL